MRSSIAWLRKMEVIAEEDEKALRTVTDARNELAHEMTAMVGGSKPPEFVEHFSTLLGLADKIEKWWITNVDLPVSLDYNGESIAADDIISGPAWSMHILAQVALGEGEEAWELHRRFSALWPDSTTG